MSEAVGRGKAQGQSIPGTSSQLERGLSYRLSYLVPPSRTVPYVFENSDEFAAMPKVLATARWGEPGGHR